MENIKFQNLRLETLRCGKCGKAVLRKKGCTLSFRKQQNGKISDVVVEIASSGPFLFTCNNCGMRQCPMITLRLPNKGEPPQTRVSVAGT